MVVNKIVSDILDSNTFVIKDGGYAFIVDAGAHVDEIKAIVGTNIVVGILLTHAHYDHILHLEEYVKEFKCKVFLHKNAVNKLYDNKGNLSYYVDKSVVLNLSSNDLVTVQDELYLLHFGDVKVIYTSGHSDCSICFIISDALFCGDFLFESGFGRYDLQENGKEHLLKSLETFKHCNGYKYVYSGHGNNSTYHHQQKNIVHSIYYLKNMV